MHLGCKSGLRVFITSQTFFVFVSIIRPLPLVLHSRLFYRLRHFLLHFRHSLPGIERAVAVDFSLTRSKYRFSSLVTKLSREEKRTNKKTVHQYTTIKSHSFENVYIYLCIYTQRFRILCYHVTKSELTCSLTTSLLVGISFCFVTAIVSSASFFDCCFHSDCDVRIKTKSTKQRAKGLDMI